MATPDEKKEIEDLKDLFGHSEVPRGLFLKFEVSRHNRSIADKGRQEKEERQRLLEQRQEEQRRRTEQLRAVRGERDREAVARHQQRNREAAQEIKQAEAAWQQEVMRKRTELKQQVADRGTADFHNARLAEQEARMLQERRDQAQREYEEHKKLAQATYDQRMRERRAHAGKMREGVVNAHTGANKKLSHMTGTQANQARQMKSAWKQQLQQNRETDLAKARDNRKHAEEVRQRARANINKQRQRRQAEGKQMQQSVDADNERAKSELMAYKKKLRKERYNARYVSQEEAAKLVQSTFRKLYKLKK
jgi:hypothetical protein